MAAIPNPTLDELMNYLLEDANGGHVYSNEKAMFGYIEQSKYLLVTRDLILAEPPDVNLETAGNASGITQVLGPAGTAFRAANPYLGARRMTSLQSMKVLAINFDALVASGIETGPAFLAAALRTRWLNLGCLWEDPDTRGTPFDEVTAVGDTHAIYGSIVACRNLADLKADAEFQRIMTIADPVRNHEFYGLQFAVANAETIWCISELLFRIRGHHYKPEYEDLIRRTFRATTSGSVELPDNFAFAPVFHTAIHPFGVRALPTMAWKFMSYSKTGDSLIIRHSGAPNGTAAITTCSAGLRILATESWYTHFENTFKKQIDLIHRFASQILDNKYSYHISASLYGLTRKTTVNNGEKDIQLSEAEQIVASVAPYLQGYVQAMNDISTNAGNLNFSFGNEKVLEKRSAANPIAQIKMQKLVEVIVTTMEKAKDSRAVMATFMNMPADRAKNRGQTTTAIVAANPAESAANT